MRCPRPLAPRNPNAGADEPRPQRLLGHSESVQLEELLASQRGAEVEVAIAHDLDGPRAQLVGQASIARLATLARDESHRPALLEGRTQPTHLALRETDELSGLRLGKPSLENLPDDGETVQLLAAHLDQLLSHQSAFQATPCRRKRTFLLGPKRTFSFCCYRECQTQVEMSAPQPSRNVRLGSSIKLGAVPGPAPCGGGRLDRCTRWFALSALPRIARGTRPPR